jgi:hypothetical protein
MIKIGVSDQGRAKPVNTNFLLIIILLAMVGGCQEGGGGTGASEYPIPGWQVTLKVSVQDELADGGVAYNRLVAGSGEKATPAFDPGWDVRAFLAGSVQAYFVSASDSGSDPTVQPLWKDIRGDKLPAEWDIAVMADPGEAITLSWILPEGKVSCLSREFILRDADGPLGQTDMCITSSMVYVGDGGIRHFVLRIS